MSENRFKFVSPGVFINEIDESQIPRTVEDIGPVVVGRAARGPIMRPVKVQSIKEFVEIFGAAEAGSSNVDYWREGGFAGPSYGAFAAQAYLKNAGPLTYVRLGGYQSPDAEETGKAGWKVKAQDVDSVENSGGAFAMFVAPLAANGTTFEANTTAKLAAIFYTDGGTVTLKGKSVNLNSDITGQAGVWVKEVEGGKKIFELVFAKDGTTYDKKKVSFDLSSGPIFIRNALNTTPSKTNSEVNDDEKKQIYWLGQTFENEIKSIVGNHFAAIIVALQDWASDTNPKDANSGGDFRYAAREAKSGWIFSQDKNAAADWEFDADTNNFVKTAPQKLFRFHTLSEDEWTQKNIKISIDNIKRSTNSFSKFGTFSVIVRKMFDKDETPSIIERFDGCTLDPASPNFIAKKIGDIHTEWDYDNRRFKEFGDFPNVSKYIYVEVDQSIKDGGADQDLLPFGFYGPQVYKKLNVNGPIGGTAYTLSSSMSFYSTVFFDGAYGVEDIAGIKSDAAFNVDFVVPQLPILDSTSNHYLSNNIQSIYWGLKTGTGATTTPNKEVTEHLRPLPSSLKDEVVSDGSFTKYSVVFSLDDLEASFNGTETKITSSTWSNEKRHDGDSFTAKYQNGEFGETQYDIFLNTLGRFTVPLFGGFDGLDITEKEPFSNRDGARVGVLKPDQDSIQQCYTLNSLLVAIDAVSDPDVLDMDILAVPGIKNKKVHQSMIAACEGRADSLALLDLQGDYTSAYEVDPDSVSESERQPVVLDAVNYVKDGLLANSSYAATYFPWVQVQDANTGKLLWVPPSVVALGTYASTKRNAGVWFAPAGFNRGGLSSDTLPAGLKVINSRLQLKAKERDSLYEVGINPIVKFPAEGVVIFGQKTLQQTASALDRVNVRRLMNFVKKEVSRIATGVLFDPNVQVTWDRFTGQVKPFLRSVQAGLGITDFRVILDETTTTPDLIDRNILYAKIFIKPARAIEFIALDFTITNSGASFND